MSGEQRKRVAAFYQGRGKALLHARRHNLPDLDPADLILLGVEKAPERLSQSDLAVVSGVGRNTISRIERGGRTDSYTFALLMWLVTPPSPKKGPRP